MRPRTHVSQSGNHRHRLPTCSFADSDRRTKSANWSRSRRGQLGSRIILTWRVVVNADSATTATLAASRFVKRAMGTEACWSQPVPTIASRTRIGIARTSISSSLLVRYEAGASDLTGHRVVAHEVLSDSKFTVDCQGEKRVTVESEWVIDASGQAGVLAKLTGVADRTDQLRTRTQCVYAHYANVGSWTEHLQRSGIETANDPFDADDAAQHHLLESGWLWMLRFNNAITSVGWTAPLSTKPASSGLDWSAYPSLASLFRDAELVGPDGGPRRSRRLQRLLDPVVDDRRIMLPTAAVTIDPLHSTGIAHALAGVERVARIILESDSRERVAMVGRYRRAVLDETHMLDQLVSTAYATMDDFPRFTAACMLYFAGAIRCEERYQRVETPTRLWNADDVEFVEFVTWACEKLVDRESGEFHDEFRQRLQPWNTAGLMDPAVANRYAYTATKKPAV